MKATRKVMGTALRPRLSATVSLVHIYAQLIDDVAGKTIAFASTQDKEFGKKAKLKANIPAAKVIGKLIGKRGADKGVTEVVFDRRDKRYHGKIKALADAAREAGLKF